MPRKATTITLAVLLPLTALAAALYPLIARGQRGRDTTRNTYVSPEMLAKRRQSDALFREGIRLEHEGDREQAEQNYRKAIKLRDGGSFAENSLADLLYEEGRGKEAIPLYRKIAYGGGSDRFDITLKYRLATLLEQEGQSDEAMKLYHRIIDESPYGPTRDTHTADNYTPDQLRGVAISRYAAKLGWTAEALSLMQEALHYAPEMGIIHARYAITLRNMKRPAEADAQAKEAVRMEPDLAKMRGLLK